MNTVNTSAKDVRAARLVTQAQQPSRLPGPESRLFSIVGPRDGKTAYIKSLDEQLKVKKHPVLRYGGRSTQAGDLHQWLEGEADKLKEQGVDLVRDRTVAFASALDVVMRQLRSASTPVLLIDGYDELSTDDRALLEEELIVPFLFPPSGEASTLVVIARDEDNALSDPMLRWEEDVVEVDESGDEVSPAGNPPSTG
jgi:hypothetical protein